jgi:hypothetical protein
VNVDWTVKDGISLTLTDLAQQFPEDMSRALISLGQRWRKTIEREMRIGAPAGQPFAPLNEITRRVKQRQSQGNILRRLDLAAARSRVKKSGSDQIKQQSARINKEIGRLRRRDVEFQGFGGTIARLSEYGPSKPISLLRIGFLGEYFKKSNRVAARWMREERRGWTQAERHWLHGMFGKVIPFADYFRPARPPISPHVGVFNQDADTSIRKTINARINNRKMRSQA